MKTNILKFIFSGILIGFLFNLFYSYLNYFLLLNNNYINPIFLSSLITVVFLITFFNIMPKYYKYIFDIEIIAKKMFFVFSIIPIFLFSLYLSFLINIYYDLSFTNYKINKSAFFAVKTISQNVDTNVNIDEEINNFMDDILTKEKINKEDFLITIQLPNNSIDYGANFVLNIKDTRNYNDLAYYTLVPFNTEFRWIYFYNFANGKNVGNTNYSITNNIKYSTPYGDFN